MNKRPAEVLRLPPHRNERVASLNVAAALLERLLAHPEAPVFARRDNGTWPRISGGAFAEQVDQLARGLIDAGVAPGARVGLMSRTCYEWVLCDLAIMAIGAVTVPIYETSSPAQVAWTARDCGMAAMFVADQQMRGQLGELDAIPDAGLIWTMTPESLDALRGRGENVTAETLRARQSGATQTSLATIVYTSGSTGVPKGCMISHGNLRDEIESIVRADTISESVLTPRTSILLFLPLAHILARIVQFAAIHNGALVGHTGLSTLAEDLHSFRPSIVLAVPRVLEKLSQRAEQQAWSRLRRRVFRSARACAIDYSRALESRTGPGSRARIKRRIFDWLVYRKLRAALGGRAALAVCGGAPLAPELAHFLRGAGLPVLEGYGLTETSAAVTFNLPTATRIGSVGRPLPGWEVRTGADSEVLVRGPGLFRGYWNNDGKTRESLDEQGWLHTGDLGSLDDGFLTITGRLKDLIVTAAGKNIAPAYFEDRLNAHWLIDQCVVIGDGRPYITALVTLDRDAWETWRLHQRKEPADTEMSRRDGDAIELLQDAIDEVNSTVSRAEQIKRFGIVAGQFTVNEELTPTQKVRRDFVLNKFADEIERLYDPRYGRGAEAVDLTEKNRELFE